MATILLVEDNDDLRESIRLQLETDHHRVMEAADGDEAIHLWRAHKPDLVITDFRMPRMDGLGVIKAVCTRQPIPPIILMSGGMEVQLRLCVLHDFPSVRYLPKEFVSSRLRQQVKELLRVVDGYSIDQRFRDS